MPRGAKTKGRGRKGRGRSGRGTMSPATAKHMEHLEIARRGQAVETVPSFRKEPRIKPMDVVILDDWGEEHQYHFEPLMVDEGLVVQGHLGAAISQLAAMATEARNGAAVSPEVLGQQLSSAIRQTFVEEGAELFLILLSGATRDGMDLDENTFNDAYRANYGELYAATAVALRQNFGPLVTRAPFGPVVMVLWEVAQEVWQEFTSGFLLTPDGDSSSTESPTDSESTSKSSPVSGPSSTS